MTNINIDNLVILNDWDRPCMFLIAKKEPLEYVSPYTRERFGTLRIRHNFRCTPLKDFGFVQEGSVFKKVNPSVATYADGSPRDWQGSEVFTIDEMLEGDHA